MRAQPDETLMTQVSQPQSAKSLLEEYAAEVARAPEGVQPAGSAKRSPFSAEGDGANIDLIMRIPVTVKVVLGSAVMPVANLTKLGRGAVIPLDRRVGEPVEVIVNGRIIAKGEVVVVDEATSRFGVSLTEIMSPSTNDKAF
jgi:flagellar motor switch protein FliN/FliY